MLFTRCTFNSCNLLRNIIMIFIVTCLRLLDWVDRDARPRHERILVFKNMFDVQEFEVCSTKILYNVC